MADKKDPQLTEHLDRQGPGAYLRNAREEANMSLKAVADMLLLSPKTLELLEADAHDRLPAPTFVRGYLRGYARALGLPSGPILDMYNRQGFEPPPLNNDATEPTQAHTSDIPVRLVTYAVAVALALFVGLWWHSQQGGGFGIDSSLFDWLPDRSQGSSPLTAEESATSPEEADANEPSIAMASDPAEELSREEPPPDDESSAWPRRGEIDAGPADPGPEGETVAMSSVEPVPPAGEGATPEAAAVDGEAIATQEAQPEASAGTDRGADPGIEDGSAPIPEEVGATDAPAGSTVTTGTAQSGLVLEFAHESWVEVYDHERVRLYFNLVQPGRVLSFDGPQPFDVLLGYGKDVQVMIDGRAFDITPFTNHGVARFSVGSESAGGATMSVASESPAESALVPDR